MMLNSPVDVLTCISLHAWGKERIVTEELFCPKDLDAFVKRFIWKHGPFFKIICISICENNFPFSSIFICQEEVLSPHVHEIKEAKYDHLVRGMSTYDSTLSPIINAVRWSYRARFRRCARKE